MFTFSRGKPIVIDCFTADASAYRAAKIDYANKFIPDWWKSLSTPDESKFSTVANMKYCTGFTSQFKRGAVLPMWSDLDFEVPPVDSYDYRWHFADSRSMLEVHTEEQWGDFFSQAKFQHIKLVSPWKFRCSDSVDFAYVPPTWWDYEAMSAVKFLPGVVNFKYQTSTNINLVITKRDQPFVQRFNYMQPMLHLVPLSERPLKIKTHLVTVPEIEKLVSRQVSFVNSYGKTKKQCPFGFTKKGLL